MRLIFLPVFLIVIPVILGLPWCCALMKNNLKRTLACLPMGYFLQLSIFQLLTFPFACLHFRFSTLCITFICVLSVCSVVSVIWMLKRGNYRFPRIRIKGWTAVYLILFLAFFCYQLYNAATLDRTYMSYDDAAYVVIANDALTQDILYSHDPYRGLGLGLNIKRSLQSSLVFPSVLSLASGVSVVTMEHTILDIYYLLLAYIVYAFLGSVLFKKENIVVFLIITGVLYTYGNYSIYSPTMRFLGLNYVGKAILAVVFFPFLFGVMIHGLSTQYRRSLSVLLILLSATASGLTLFGTVTMVGNVGLTVSMSLIRKPREWKKVKYIICASILPALYAGVYFLYTFSVF